MSGFRPSYSFLYVVGIATRYGLEGPGMESRWGTNVLHQSSQALGPTQPPVLWVSGYSPVVRRQRGGVNHLPQSRADVIQGV
jgi:hypothetical protein